ncbi:hypothetical protein ElyMa_006116200 [Elysia marginata]|uniref:Uncharacterized protein n=1 Tax=Elysia marginata TaxID=1093978 RepID=A0AAV4GUA7_9GAST|nr:hypothetical protein ElyMa_006116200 [Elysia marginata]
MYLGENHRSLPIKLWHSISTTMPSAPGFRPITTLPMTLNNDLKILQNRSISLTSQKDLETLRKIAERRQEWVTFTADIKKAAEAARSDDTPSGRP